MLSVGFEAMRVTPAFALGRNADIGIDGSLPPMSVARDHVSSWSCHIVYEDAKRDRSERRITCQTINGYGEATHIQAFCHERRAPRSFLIDRIVEMYDIETGELIDPYPHFQLLRQTGALPYEDKGFSAFLTVVLFMAKCDGHYHPLEADALEAALTAYCLRFDGDDALIEKAMRDLPRLAPDGHDVSKAIKRLKASPTGRRISRLILDHSSLIIDADGKHHADEIAWALEIGGALKFI